MVLASGLGLVDRDPLTAAEIARLIATLAGSTPAASPAVFAGRSRTASPAINQP